MAGRSNEDVLRAIEQDRLRALREGDLVVAKSVHADEFELITPDGVRFSRAAYLDAIETGTLRYLIWTPEEMRVRILGDAAALRYRSTIEVIHEGTHYGPGRYWHTDTYERRDGRWQVVWSHATEIE